MLLGFAAFSVGVLGLCSYLLVARWARTAVPDFNAPEIKWGEFSQLATSEMLRQDPQPWPTVLAGDPLLAPVTPEKSANSSGTSRVGRGQDLREAGFVAAPAAIFAVLETGDWVRSSKLLSDDVRGAITQMSGNQVEGLGDFRSTVDLHDYQLDSVKLRGTIGEQVSSDGFEDAGAQVTWPAGGSTEFGPSNNPGWDFAIDGHPVNVKVVGDADSLGDHFVEYPDIPVVLNSDAANIPSDAIQILAGESVDPADLVGEHLVLVQESLNLSGIEGLQEDAASAAGDEVVDQFGDAVPLLSALIVAVRSGVREGKLVASGDTTRKRAATNFGIDFVSQGGGAATGASIGLMIDAATFGATLGVPTLVGTVGGRWFGKKAGSYAKLTPLRRARDHVVHRASEYNNAIERGCQVANGRLNEFTDRTLSEMRAAQRRSHMQFIAQASAIEAALNDEVDREIRGMLYAIESTSDEVELRFAQTQLALEASALRRLVFRRRRRALTHAMDFWRRQANAAAAGDGSMQLDALVVTENGRERARSGVQAIIDMSEAATGGVVSANEWMFSSVVRARVDAVAAVREARRCETDAARKMVEPLATSLEKSRTNMVRELRAAGVALGT